MIRAITMVHPPNHPPWLAASRRVADPHPAPSAPRAPRPADKGPDRDHDSVAHLARVSVWAYPGLSFLVIRAVILPSVSSAVACLVPMKVNARKPVRKIQKL